MKAIPTIIILFYLQILTFGVFGQSADIQLSNDILLRQSDEYQGLIHSDESGYILHIYERSGRGLLDLPGRTLILEKYDKAFEQVYSYAYGDADMVSVELFAVANKLAWIVIEKTGSYKYTYSLIPIDYDGKEGKKQKLFEIEVAKTIDVPFTYLRPSPDSSTVAFVALFDSDNKKRETEVYTAVIDENASLLWDKFSTLKGNQKQYDVMDFQLNAKNELVLLAKYFRDSKAKNEVDNKRGEKVPGYQINSYTISAESRIPKKQTLELDEAFVHDARLKFFPSGDLYSVGLLTEKHKGNISGLYVAQHDDLMQVTGVQKSYFDIQDLISLDKGDANVNLRKKDNKGLDDEFKLIDIFQLPNRDLIITAEENFARVQNQNNFNNSTFNRGFNNGNNNVTYLNSNDVVILRTNSAGEMDGITLLPKKQMQLIYRGFNYFKPSDDALRESSLHLSHVNLVHNDKLYFLYNEHRDNFRERKTRKVANRLNRMEPALVTIHSDLEYEIKPLLPEDANTLIAPTRSQQIGSNQYFVTFVEPHTNERHNIKIGVMTFR